MISRKRERFSVFETKQRTRLHCSNSEKRRGRRIGGGEGAEKDSHKYDSSFIVKMSKKVENKIKK